MISSEDYDFITKLDSSMPEQRAALLKEKPHQVRFTQKNKGLSKQDRFATRHRTDTIQQFVKLRVNAGYIMDPSW